ncbi:MAG: type II toxin-antitoxin system VapC family toxin [Chloroflexi bacterium]|nr:type II toxin-antitoxin system VapC family toxin [Chloroflexota bacterium]
MRLLLDTHIWIWSLLEPGRLSRRVARRLEDPANELWLSSISVWETLLLAERGRIRLDVPPIRWIEAVLRAFPVRDAALTREVATVSRAVDLPHQDPADRFIAASAIVYELALVTADERLLRSKKYRTISNADQAPA